MTQVINHDKRAFEYNGSLDTLAGHCKNFDIDYNRARNAKHGYGLSAVEALDCAKRDKPKDAIVIKQFECELCKRPTMMKDESIMMGKCMRCYMSDHMFMRA